MLFDKQDDINNYISKEMGIDKRVIDSVIDNYWLSIRHYITNPLESKGGILLSGFCNMSINPYGVEGYIKRNNIDSEFYNKLLKQLKNEKGQTK